MTQEDGTSIRSTARSFRLIETIVERGDGQVTELARETGINKSTVHAHLSTLVELGYLRKDGTRYLVGPKLVDLGGAPDVFKIIDELHQRGPCPRETLVERTGINETAAAIHLDRLEEFGYVIQRGDEYSLSLKFLDIGGHLRDQLRLDKVVEPKLRRLADETGELANLMIEENGEGVYLRQVKGEHGLELDTYVGFRTPLHATAKGKSILSCMSHDRVEEVIDEHGLPAFTSKTITDQEELFDEIERIRERGFALDDGERLDGLRCVGAPIEPREGPYFGAISISAPISRMRGEVFEEEVPERVINAANVIELDINYS